MLMLVLILMLVSVTDYDLVRIHHPDSAYTKSQNVSSEIAHARFRAITHAYDVLSGKVRLDGSNTSSSGYQRARSGNAYPHGYGYYRHRPSYASRDWGWEDGSRDWRSRGASADAEVEVDDGTKDRIIIIVGALVRPPNSLSSTVLRELKPLQQHLTRYSHS